MKVQLKLDQGHLKLDQGQMKSAVRQTNPMPELMCGLSVLQAVIHKKICVVRVTVDCEKKGVLDPSTDEVILFLCKRCVS